MRVTRILACLFAVVVIAAGVGSGAQNGEVPLYTNKDLEQFGPPATPAPPPLPPSATEVDRQWDFVQEHLDREYSRIVTDRRLDIEESLVEPAPEPYDDGGYVGYPIYGRYGLYGYGYGGFGRRGGNNRVRDTFYLYYDQRTARHGYLVPRKTPPTPELYRLYDPMNGRNRGLATISHGHRGLTGGQVQRSVRLGGPSRSGSPGKVKAISGSRSGSRGRSSSPSRGTARVSSRGRSGGRGSRR